MTDEPPRYLTAEDVAAELGVHIQTAQAYFRTGGLPGRKIGKHWTTTRDALDRWVEAGNTPDDHGGELPPLERKDTP